MIALAVIILILAGPQVVLLINASSHPKESEREACVFLAGVLTGLLVLAACIALLVSLF